MIAFLVFLLLLGGCTLVATVGSIALSRLLPSQEAAFGLSMLVVGVLLFAIFPDASAVFVAGLVVLSHGLAGGLIWYRKKVFGR